nr:MAG TPA: hypothetical protein [Caudoviricetes sp.]
MVRNQYHCYILLIQVFYYSLCVFYLKYKLSGNKNESLNFLNLYF